MWDSDHMKFKGNLNYEALYSEIQASLFQEGAYVDDGTVPPISFSPYVMQSEKYLYLSYLCFHFHSAMEKLLRVLVQERDILRLFPELRQYTRFTKLLPNYSKWIHLARFDVIENKNGKFKILETNCDCPGGMVFNAIIKEELNKLELFEHTFKDVVEQSIDNKSTFFRSMIESYNEVTGQTPHTIGLMTSRFRPIENEINLMIKVANDIGINAIHIKAQDLECKNNKLCMKNNIIDLVYHKIDAYVKDDTGLLKYCLYNKSIYEVAAYMESISKKEIVYFNSFPSIFLAENKKILALLKDPYYKALFSKDELTAIDEFCPETFCLYNNDKELRDKVHHIIVNKDKYVIKSALDTRGRSVYIGKNISINDWRALVNKAIDMPYIVQEYIDSVKEEVILPASFVHEPMYTTLAVFLLKGIPSGLFVRSSKNDITNVIGKDGCIRVSYITNDEVKA